MSWRADLDQWQMVDKSLQVLSPSVEILLSFEEQILVVGFYRLVHQFDAIGQVHQGSDEGLVGESTGRYWLTEHSLRDKLGGNWGSSFRCLSTKSCAVGGIIVIYYPTETIDSARWSVRSILGGQRTECDREKTRFWKVGSQRDKGSNQRLNRLKLAIWPSRSVHSRLHSTNV